MRAGFLFPRSIASTRTLHIIDWTLQSILERLPWYAPWQASYKDVCEFLCEAHYRDALSSSLQHLELSPEDAHAHIKILCHFGSNFAKWRWSILHTVVEELGRVRIAVRLAWGVVVTRRGVLKLSNASL